MQDLVKCPNCQMSIDGDYFNCTTCDNAGMIPAKLAEIVTDNNNFWTQMLNKPTNEPN
jgi:hypothetical protein